MIILIREGECAGAASGPATTPATHPLEAVLTANAYGKTAHREARRRTESRGTLPIASADCWAVGGHLAHPAKKVRSSSKSGAATSLTDMQLHMCWGPYCCQGIMQGITHAPYQPPQQTGRLSAEAGLTQHQHPRLAEAAQHETQQQRLHPQSCDAINNEQRPLHSRSGSGFHCRNVCPLCNMRGSCGIPFRDFGFVSVSCTAGSKQAGTQRSRRYRCTGLGRTNVYAPSQILRGLQ